MTTLEKPKTVTLDLTADEATELVDYVLWSEYLSASDDLQSAADACSVTTFGQVVEARDALDAVERRARGLGWDSQGPVSGPVTVTEDPTWLWGIAVGGFDRWADHVGAFGSRKQGADNFAEVAEAIDRLAALRRVLEKLLAAGVPAPEATA